MPKINLDYSDYQTNALEQFRATHSSNTYVLFDFFRNQVFENADEKILTVVVTDFHEDDYMTELYAEAQNIEVDAYKEQLQAELEQSNPNYRAEEQEAIAHNEAMLKRYADHFVIDMPSPFERENVEMTQHNAFSGACVHIPLGEGILDFCYADFSVPLQAFRQSIGLLYDDAALAVMLGGMSPQVPTESIHSRNEETLFHYGRYTETMAVLHDVIYASLYTAIFPPVLLSRSRAAVNHYARFITSVQTELLELLVFCFDLEYYPAVLGDLHPAERFAIYNQVKDHPSSFQRTEYFTQSHTGGGGIAMPFGMAEDQLISHMSKKFILTQEHKAFQKQFDLSDAALEACIRFPTFVSISYACDNLYDMLLLEFTKMLERGVRFKKCKNCGRYFILKGNYKTDYCDRVSDDETKTCQTIASLRHYREKVSGNAAWKLYNKFYKRYHARMKAGNIPSDIFKQWQYQATAMRDDCGQDNEKIATFDSWLHKSFPNGKRS